MARSANARFCISLLNPLMNVLVGIEIINSCNAYLTRNHYAGRRPHIARFKHDQLANRTGEHSIDNHATAKGLPVMSANLIPQRDITTRSTHFGSGSLASNALMTVAIAPSR